MYLLYGSPWLRVRRVSVLGVRVLTATQVQAAAGVRGGTPLAAVDTAAVAGRLRAALPRIAAVEVDRAWPNVLTVKVTERTPKVVLKNGGNFVEVDANGVQYATDQSAPPGVPLVEMTAAASDGPQAASNRFFTTARLVHAAVQVATDLPEPVAKQTAAISVRSWDSISLQLGGGRTVLWGSCEQGQRKAVVLLALMRAAAGAVRYDVSAPSEPAWSGS